MYLLLFGLSGTVSKSKRGPENGGGPCPGGAGSGGRAQRIRERVQAATSQYQQAITTQQSNAQSQFAQNDLPKDGCYHEGETTVTSPRKDLWRPYPPT